MKKKIIIFIVLFIASVAIMIIFNDDIDSDKRYECNLYQTMKVDQNKMLNINLINTKDEKAEIERCEIVETTKLKDSVEIYRYRFYDDRNMDYEINVDGNTISIEDYLGNITIYHSIPFISNTQFEDYMVNFPKRVYKIYIPEGMEYSIK